MPLGTGRTMSMDTTPEPLKVLERFRNRSLERRPRPGEVCELCGEPIPDEHAHLVDLTARGLLCACRPCHLLFSSRDSHGGRYLAVPDRYLSFPEFSLS